MIYDSYFHLIIFWQQILQSLISSSFTLFSPYYLLWGGQIFQLTGILYIFTQPIYFYLLLSMQKMIQQDPKRKVIKIIENLAIELQNAGISDKIILKSTNDPWDDLQTLCRDLISLAASDQSQHSRRLHDSAMINSNESIVLECLKYFIDVHMSLSKLSKMLFEGEYSREFYKAYRKLYETISTTTNCLCQYQSQDQDFLRQKQDLISQNLQICEQIQNVSSADTQYKVKDNNTENESQQQTIANLKKEIEALNQMIRQNDDEFTLEIQRYNNTLYDMQETISEYEVRMDKIRDYEATIDELEHKLIRLKEEKYRDDMLIDNMSKKIRMYEKQRGGVDAFLSPRAGNYSRKNLISPVNRILNSHNQSGLSNIMGTEQRGRNFYGERLTSS